MPGLAGSLLTFLTSTLVLLACQQVSDFILGSPFIFLLALFPFLFFLPKRMHVISFQILMPTHLYFYILLPSFFISK